MNIENIEVPEIKKPLGIGWMSLNNNATIPFASTPESNGYDLCSIEEVVLEPTSFKAIKCGFAIEIPVNHVMFVCPKSGLAAKYGITVLNSPGVIDSDYRGEIMVILINLGNLPYKFNIGDKLAQGVFIRTEKAEFWPVEKLSDTERGTGGLGSTGR